MRLLGRILAWLGALLVLAVAGLAVFLAVSPPELLRVGDGYAAKIVCSNVFMAHRDANEVLATDVQAPGNPLLKLVSVDVNQGRASVTARMLGFVAPMTAVFRARLGCALVPDRNEDAAMAQNTTPSDVLPSPSGDWPVGESVTAPDARVGGILADPKMTGPGMRAVVVVHGGKIIGETYADGYNDKPLLGWSVTKTVNAALLGTLIKAGKLGLDDANLLPQWAGDSRKDIKIRDLADMESGLKFEEAYGDVTDTTRMLYLEPDMAAFAAKQPALSPPGQRFNYSTGTPHILARVWMDKLGDPQAALDYPRQALFGPIGMTSAILETDEKGTFAAASYMYATGRDWARFGLLLAQDGMWNGQRLLPDGFVQMMIDSNGQPGGYSQMQTWLLGPTETEEKKAGLPADTFWAVGHDGQSIAVIPSQQLVVVRMGLTPSDLGYGPEPMLKAIIAALGAQ